MSNGKSFDIAAVVKLGAVILSYFAMIVWLTAKINFGFEYLSKDVQKLNTEINTLKLDVRDLSERLTSLEAYRRAERRDRRDE